MYLWEWTQSVKIYTLHVNVHSRASTMEERLNSQVDRMTWLVDISQPLSSTTCASPTGAWKSGHVAIDGGYT